MSYKPKYYGMTDADQEYIAQHGLTPDDGGAYPRLDKMAKPVERIASFGLPGEHTIPVDIPLPELLQQIRDGYAVLNKMISLYQKRHLTE